MPTLAAKEYCTGCTACTAVCPKGCITMEEDENGFLCPVIDADQCVLCGLCEKVCPIVNPLTVAVNTPKAYAAYSTDETVRMQSSSGGVFTEIAKAVLADSGAVYGAAYNEQFDVVHIYAESEENLAKLRGAKYAQSDLRRVFKDVKRRLNHGQKVLFSGTPCQVGGLKGFLRREHTNLLTVDFVCHSVPSPMAWREYVKYRAQQDNGGELPTSINLRSKQSGWTNYQYSNLFTYADGYAHAAKSSESLYMKLFVGGYINRESCANCPFKGYSRVSDLTLGDFWGIWDILPDMDGNKGTSVVLVQSQRGTELLRSVSDQLVVKPVTLEEASRKNGAMLKNAQPNARRTEALGKIRVGEIRKCESWFEPVKPSFLQQTRRVGGSILRRIGKKA